MQTHFKLFHTCIYNPSVQMFSLANHAAWMPVYIPIFELPFFFTFHSSVMKSLNLPHCLCLSPRVATEPQRGSSVCTKQFLCVFLINCVLCASGCYFKEFLPVLTDLWSVYEFLELLMRLPDALSCLVWPTLNSQSADCWTE